MDYIVKPAYKILNLGEVKNATEKVVNSQIAYTINKSILRLYGKYLNDDGTHVDYQGMKNSEEFKQFSDDTRRLREVKQIF